MAICIPFPFPLGELPLPAELAARMLSAVVTEPRACIDRLDQIASHYPGLNRSLGQALVSVLEAAGLCQDPAFVDQALAEATSLRQTPFGRSLGAQLLEFSGRSGQALEWLQAAQASLATGNPHLGLEIARLLLKEKRRPEACLALRRAVETWEDTTFLTRAARLLERMGDAPADLCVRTLKLAVLSPYTVDLWTPLLRLGLFRSGIWCPRIQTPPYGTYQQAILDPGSILYTAEPEFVLLAPTWRELRLEAVSADPDAVIEEAVQAIVAGWDQIKSRIPARILQHSFEVPAFDPAGNLGSALAGGRATLIRRINLALAQCAPAHGVALLDLDHCAGQYGKRGWDAPQYWHMAKQDPAPEALPTLVSQQVALIRASLGLTKKVLVLDLDNTLWGGVIGEDGLKGIQIGAGNATSEAFLALQRYVLHLKERGIVLAVCSKNNEADAQAPFRDHEGMLLRLEDFAAFQANWNDKPNNIRAIAQTLNLGLDSFVFLDDNPTERALVRQELPEVAVPELPADPSSYVPILDALGYFEAISLSAEDLQRSAQYQSNARRDSLKASSTSLDDFLAGLHMESQHGPVGEQVLPRVLQLLGKTNQFNLTTRRHSEDQLRQILNQPLGWSQFFRLKDKFDDSGLVAVILATPAEHAPATWVIDSWLMSCRVIGRQMEHFMFQCLVRAAQAAGIRAIQASYLPTAKNGMVANLLEGLGLTLVREDPDGRKDYRLDLTQALSPTPVLIRDLPLSE